MAVLSGIGEWVAYHSRGVGLVAVAVAVLAPVFASKSLWRKQKETAGWRRWLIILELAIIWMIPVSAALSWYASDRASATASNEVATLKKANAELPRKLYSGMTSELFSVTDTNRFIWRKTAAGSWRVCMLLKAAAVPGSLIGSIESTTAMSNKNLLGPNTTRKNVFPKEFFGDWWDFRGMVFHIQYLADTQETNLVHQINLPHDDVILADGRQF